MLAPLQPAYRRLYETGELESRAFQAREHLTHCDVCAWDCGIDRTAGKMGVCNTGVNARVVSYGPHHGEEDPLRGWRGSGTIFFNRCNLRCQYCQNYDISQSDHGYEVTPEELAGIMLKLQETGCHNINFVSPSHVVPQIIAAIWPAAMAGLNLPLVYNTGGFDALCMLKLLDGIIDIYMPDMKYANQQIGLHYSKIHHYPQVNQVAVREMHRQVGDLEINTEGIATRGLLVRHLVLPGRLAGTETIVRFLAEEISENTYLNLMDQYRPAFNASQYPKINRPITRREYQEALDLAISVGIKRLDKKFVL